MDKEKENVTFEKYREQMHPEEEKGRSVMPTPSRAVATAWGIFMIIVYVGMGVLLLINFFNWTSGWEVPRYVVGIALIIYGLYRGYRSFIGTDYYRNK